MTTKLPGYHLSLGVLFFGLGWTIKSQLPHTLGLAPSIQFPCAFLSAVLLPFGTFLALRALLIQTERRRQLLVEFLCGLFFLIMLLSFYFFNYFIIDRMLVMTRSAPDVLPKMSEAARTFPQEAQREKMAGYVYKMYGTIIAYPLDDNQVVYYVPSQEDRIEWRKTEKTNSQIKKSTAFIEKIMFQFPYLFALYASTYFAAFLVGGTWLAMKTLKSSTVPQS